MRKHISHFARLNMSCTIEPLAFKPTIREVRETSVDERTKRVKSIPKMKTFDRHEEMKAFHVNDFSLENLIAIGAKLDSTHLTASPHKTVTDITNQLANIADNINN